MAYGNYTLNKDVKINNKEKGGAFLKVIGDHNKSHTLVELSDNTVTTAGSPSAQHSTTDQIPHQLAENVTSGTRSNVKLNDLPDKDHINYLKRKKRKSKLKYFALLIALIIVIAAASSSVTAFILIQVRK